MFKSLAHETFHEALAAVYTAIKNQVMGLAIVGT